MFFAKKKKKGFTLIELLVVIAIIGILATIVLVSLNTARQKARDARRESDIRQISLAMEMYYDSNNSVYPNALNSLVSANYFQALPVAPNPGSYAFTPGSSTYCIYATLEASPTNPYFYANQNGTGLKSTSGCP